MDEKTNKLLEAINEIETLREKHKFNSHEVLTLTILKICEINNLGYEDMKNKFINAL